MTIINITNQEMKALTWMNEDVEDLVCIDQGSTVKVVYEADKECQFMDAVGIYSKEDFLACVMNTTEKLN